MWYHLVLGHCGGTSLYNTISRTFYLKGLQQKAKSLNCAVYQLNRPTDIQYGHLPERQADLVLWFSVAVDLIGPWKSNARNIEIEFNALTCIDPVTNLVELIRINNKSSAHIAQQFENVWLA